MHFTAENNILDQNQLQSMLKPYLNMVFSWLFLKLDNQYRMYYVDICMFEKVEQLLTECVLCCNYRCVSVLSIRQVIGTLYSTSLQIIDANACTSFKANCSHLQLNKY